MDSKEKMRDILERAGKAAAALAVLDASAKNKALLAIAEGINGAREDIKRANAVDMQNARKAGRNNAFLDRLKLDDRRIDGMCSMFRQVASLKDPVGRVLEKRKRPNGLVIEKVSVPIGVIGIIYEARPNVTADCISLCLKSGNVAVLRGGSDAVNSNKAIYEAAGKAAAQSGMTKDAFILIEDTSRELVDAMLSSTEGIDLIMPRGGESLIKEVVDKSKVPVIKHYKGICHVYVDKAADLKMAEKVCLNAKVQRPGVCNAMETMLVHEKIAERFLPAISKKLMEAGVAIKGCGRTRAILGGGIAEATDTDFATEWLDLVLNIRVVSSMEEALGHIARFGSKHSDAIVTRDRARGLQFAKKVDSAAVYINASTRFTDGGQFGKGAEVGISTDKLHARGPMGLEELTTYKYVIYGRGQIRE